MLDDIKLDGELSEIEFNFHPTLRGAVQGVKFFPNGYGVSITTNVDGKVAKGNWKDKTFEISILKKISEEITDDEKVVYDYDVLDESDLDSLENKDPDYLSLKENWGVWIDVKEEDLLNKVKIISELRD